MEITETAILGKGPSFFLGISEITTSSGEKGLRIFFDNATYKNSVPEFEPNKIGYMVNQELGPGLGTDAQSTGGPFSDEVISGTEEFKKWQKEGGELYLVPKSIFDKLRKRQPFPKNVIALSAPLEKTKQINIVLTNKEKDQRITFIASRK